MGIQINGQTDRISAVDGSFSIQDLAEVNVTGVATASNFKTGTSNVHSTGYECANINATGIVTAASANFTGNVSVGGTLTYQDVTNIDSVGIITARAGVKVPDSQTVFLGTDDDLRIFHDGSQNAINSYTSNPFNIISNGNTTIKTNNNESMAVFKKNNAVELYYDNSKKFETTSDGATITGELGFASGGTYQLKLSDNQKIRFGGGNDLQIYHDGSHSYIDDSGTGDIRIRSNNVRFDKYTGETIAQFIGDGRVELYYDNSKKLETKTDGVDITGELQCDSLDVDGGMDITGTATFHNNIHLQDSDHIYVGTGFDIDIYHDGSHSYVKDNGSGNLKLVSNGTAVQIEKSDGENMAIFRTDGSVDLFYDNNKKFETNTNGIRVSGRVEINGSNGRIEYNNVANTFEFFTGGNKVAEFLSSGHFVPGTNNTYDLGSNLYRWRNIYTNDLNLSNEGSTNDVDGTWGNYTIQEGENDLYLINRRNGKKYKFNLTEVN